MRRAEWERNAAGQVLPVPETWDKAPTAPEILALVTCPACKKPSALLGHKHHADRNGRVSPGFSCPQDGCAWEGVLLLDRFHKKPLWAVAVERTSRRGEITAEVVHVSADSEAEARREFAGQVTWGTRIVAVARAIGFHAGDEHGETLIA